MLTVRRNGATEPARGNGTIRDSAAVVAGTSDVEGSVR